MWRAKRTPPRPRPRLVPRFTAECLDEAVDRVSPPPRPVHPHPAAHEDNCGYQFEQYPFECTCGAAGFLITWIGGNCPVQAEGTIDGEPFYFRARGSRWSIEVGDWEHSESCMKWPDAGWMSETMVLMLISRSVALYRNRPPPARPCGCHQCLIDRDEKVTFGGLTLPAATVTFVVCATCGNKRCPHATDHRHACSDSNKPGQQGSVYGGHELRTAGSTATDPLDAADKRLISQLCGPAGRVVPGNQGEVQ